MFFVILGSFVDMEIFSNIITLDDLFIIISFVNLDVIDFEN